MDEVRQGDTAVDVGAFVGLYTVALAKRVGPQGFIFSFEPDPTNFPWLNRHIMLNHVENNVKLYCAALGDAVQDGYFAAGRGPESSMGAESEGGIKVHVTTLDEEFPKQRIDILKIDVEGFEEKVLRGGMQLLKDASRCPRTIYVEVHPYAWKRAGTTSTSFLCLLKECNYGASTLSGQPVYNVNCLGKIVAHKNAVDQRRPS